MKASSRFLVNNPSLPIQKEGGILPINILSTINNKTNVMSLVVSSVDALYYYLLHLLDKGKMYTLRRWILSYEE